jgi:alanine racemase
VISQIRIITAGESVGYGRKFMAEKPTKVATIPMVMQTEFLEVGEMGLDLYHKKDKKAKILGSVCMDMLMVDVTEIDCTEGDSVIVFMKAQLFRKWQKKLNTIPYEVLNSISQRVKRVFYR